PRAPSLARNGAAATFPPRLTPSQASRMPSAAGMRCLSQLSTRKTDSSGGAPTRVGPGTCESFLAFDFGSTLAAPDLYNSLDWGAGPREASPVARAARGGSHATHLFVDTKAICPSDPRHVDRAHSCRVFHHSLRAPAEERP